MAKKDNELQRIIDSLSGNITPDEERLLHAWIALSDSNQRTYDEAVKIWESSRLKLSHPNPETEQEWHKLSARISRQQSSTFSSAKLWLGIAACLALFVFLGIYFVTQPSVIEETSQPPMLTVTTSNEVKMIYLPDSTMLWLNVNSEISYSPDFATSERKVNLKGEAYFVVTSDTTHPFSVQTKNASIIVTGTSFNAKENDSIVNVVVVEGRVHLRDNLSDQQVLLTKGEKGVRSNASVQETVNTDASFASWRKINNPIYTNEISNPLQFLRLKYKGEENQFSQTVIDGSIRSTASLATFRNITITATYKKPNGKVVVTRFTINDQLSPGSTISYHKRLLDIFTKSPQVALEIEKAESVK
jgi:transmembrane sensor